MSDRSQFTFYDSFAASLKRIRNKQARCDAYDAIVNYALYGIEPDLDDMPDTAAIVFLGAKPNLDASRRKSENGKAGGSRKQTESKPEASDKQTESKNKNKDKNKNKIKDKNKCYISSSDEEDKSAQARFVPPTVEEVEAYCRERGNQVNPASFVDFYSSKGWKVGNSAMKDWKAAVRTWEQRDQPKRPYGATRDEHRDDSEALAQLARIRERMRGDAG